MLSQAEIDALVGAAATTPAATGIQVQPPALSAAGRSIKAYDFRRPDKFSKDHLRTLQAIHENVARVAAARLSARLRTSVSITLADTSQMIYDEYIQGLSLPTQLVLLVDDELGGPCLMDLDLGLALAGVERMLGGAGRVSGSRREPTPIESSLVARIVDDLITSLDEGWAHLVKLNLRVGETALGPALLRVAAPSHVVAVVTYEVRLTGHTTPLTLCYPHASIESLMPRLSATAWFASPDPSNEGGAGRAELSAALRSVGIPVTAVLGSVELSVEALVGLQPGDTIRLEERASAPVLLSVMDQARAWAQPGRVGDRLALRVVSPLEKVEA